MPQQSKLAALCEKFIQAGWLIALITAPLYFNIYSSRVFEPDKISLIRTLALVMGAAWLILRAEQWRGPSRREGTTGIGTALREWVSRVTQANPLTIPTLLLLAAYVISTLLSLSPTVSFFGSYQRLQGLYTFSSYIIIFFLAASLLKTRAEVERAVSIALVTSFPIALYGILQHYFLDPLPWIGDVTARVASTLGNSIFIGSFLILTIPLAIARLIQTSGHAAAEAQAPRRVGLYAAAIATFLLVAALWSLSFDLGAKSLIEGNFSGTLTPEQLSASSLAFSIAMSGSIIIIMLWWGAAFLFKQRAANFLLTAVYASLLAVQFVALFFSQSRGPLLGMLGGLFTFGVLYALVRGARKLAFGAVSAAVLVVVLLAIINIPNSPLSFMRELPYVGRLGRVFELEGGTGRVRVLIWQGALQLVLPHEALWAPTTGEDAFNAIRPLVGYGPETMYVAYNKFYPPELGTLESRNATPDRSHNETFDALVTTGLFGFIAENILFLVIFYLAAKWLGLVPSKRARNIFVALWFGMGTLLAVLFGFTLGWEFIGVALPGGMMLGFFAYLIVFALRTKSVTGLQSPVSTLWLVALTALFVAYFIEIHFGIAIVTTRVYFWFFAAVFVALGARSISMSEQDAPVAVQPAPISDSQNSVKPKNAPARKSSTSSAQQKNSPRPVARVRRVSSSPLITFAFLLGFVIAVMGYDYINTNNVSALGSSSVSGLDIVIAALTIKATTAGGMPSWAMAWLFLSTLLLGVAIGMAEWGRAFSLSVRDWLVAALLIFVLAFAIFSGLAFYHVILIATTGSGVLDALLASVTFFTVFMLLMVTITAVSLLFDEPLPSVLVRRATNWVVLPVLVIVTGILVSATNVDPIRADMLYKQAAGLSGQDANSAVQLYRRALLLQPQQDFYYLFLGRAYLDAAKIAPDAATRTQNITNAEAALKTARAINPFNTDHSANLARLAQAGGALEQDFNTQSEAYQRASEYFAQATRLSPNTPHLYDQHAQALLEYQALLRKNNAPAKAEQVRQQALQQLDTAQKIDPTFCLTYAVRAQAQNEWQARATDALEAIRRAPACGDVFIGEGLGIAVTALAQAGDEAAQANASAAFEQLLTDAVNATPTLEVYTTLANFYSKAGRISQAITAIDGALANIPTNDEATRKRYQDFRFTLVNLQNALDAAQAAPNDIEAQRAVANQWLQRGQFDLARAAYQKILALKADDYNAQRNLALILITQNQLEQAVSQIRQLAPGAPEQDRILWQKLETAIASIAGNDTNQAITLIEELAAQADKQDFALVSALRALADKVRAGG